MENKPEEQKEQEVSFEDSGNNDQQPQQENEAAAEEEQKRESSDNFSEPDDEYEVNVKLVNNNKTTSSNFRFDINLANKMSEETNTLGSHKEYQEDKKTESKGSEENKKEEAKQNPDKIIEGSSGDSEGEDQEPNEQIEKSLRTTKEFIQTSTIFSLYSRIRENFRKTGQLYEDKEFQCNSEMLADLTNIEDNEFEITFQRPKFVEDNLTFFEFEERLPNQRYNIKHEFKINKGAMNDKYLLSSLLMLFTKNEEFFSNLIVDFDNVEENIKAGFCGFTFFIDGEWKIVTVDTRLPFNEEKDVLSKSSCLRAPYWLSLFEKAYAKAYGSYSVLNTMNIKDFLVDFTGGWSKKVPLKFDEKEGIDEKKKNYFFDEISRRVNQNYLVGCMKYEEKENKEFDAKIDEDNEEEEKIVTNSLYVVIDIQDYEGIKLIFLANHWDKGKYTDSYGPDDEQWEANKRMTDYLQYTVSTTDGTTWMSFDDFLKNFNFLYYCRIFPEDWSQYNIAGQWIGESSGGAPQKEEVWYPIPRVDKKTGGINKRIGLESKKTKNMGVLSSSKFLKNSNSNIKFSTSNIPKQTFGKGTIVSGTIKESNVSFKKTTGLNSTINNKSMKSVKSIKTIDSTNVGGLTVANDKDGQKTSKKDKLTQCSFKRDIIVDTDDCFFLNPQYKIGIHEGTKMIISLMQEDQKVKQNPYLKCNFIIIITRGKHSRVWDIKPNNIIKKCVDEKEDFNRREIVCKLDFAEIIKKFNSQNAKKLLKCDHVFVNLIPFIDFNEKYEVEQRSKSRIFNPYHPEAKYWLRIFSNQDIYISELKKPFECTVSGTWEKDVNAGGPRLLLEKNVYLENPYWPVNPQFFIKFNNNLRTKIICRKKEGLSFAEENKIGVMITRPRYYDEDEKQLEEARISAHKKAEKDKVKLDQIQKVIKSTNKILKTKTVNIEEIYPKQTINSSETVYESAYGNAYCASIQKSFNKLESPLIVIPTLDSKDTEFKFEMKIYSTRKMEISPLYGQNSACLVGEWTSSNAGGSHLDIDVNNKDKNSDLDWMQNPKFLMQFDSKDWIKDLRFEIIISRSESRWKRRLSMSMINAMMSCYIFKFEREKWKENCMNKDQVDFMPKNEVIINYYEAKADPKGYVIMPATYGKNVTGYFNIMIRCDHSFTLTPFNEKK